jgi:hypothetical protein
MRINAYLGWLFSIFKSESVNLKGNKNGKD